MNAIFASLVIQLCVLSVRGAMWVTEMENLGFYEGDMVLDPDEFEHGWNVSRGYASIKGRRWPNAVVPYVIKSTIGENGIRAIKAAMANYHKYTCIRWKRRTNEASYVSFYKGGGCSSPVGHRDGRINHISLAPGCWYTGIVMHEMGHTLGFYHEQSRPDRDKYVRIIWSNIDQKMAFNFNKHSTRSIDSLGTPYDFRSMMHYGSTAFGRGQTTIQTIDPAKQSLIGNRAGFSSTDIKQLRLMYKCPTKPTKPTEPTKPNPKPKPPKPTGCKNLEPHCVAWSKQGYCKGSFGNYMKTNCCLACRSRPTVSRCFDKNRSCAYWAGRGECRRNPNYMLDTCKKSCNVC